MMFRSNCKSEMNVGIYRKRNVDFKKINLIFKNVILIGFWVPHLMFHITHKCVTFWQPTSTTVQTVNSYHLHFLSSQGKITIIIVEKISMPTWCCIRGIHNDQVFKYYDWHNLKLILVHLESLWTLQCHWWIMPVKVCTDGILVDSPVEYQQKDLTGNLKHARQL
jgi:hypothetical protein